MNAANQRDSDLSENVRGGVSFGDGPARSAATPFDREAFAALDREEAITFGSLAWKRLIRLGHSHAAWHIEQAFSHAFPAEQFPQLPEKR